MDTEETLTSEVISRCNSKLATIVLEILNPVGGFGCRISSATLPTIHSSDGRAKAGFKTRANISGPEPESGLEGKNLVLSHFLWWSQ